MGKGFSIADFIGAKTDEKKKQNEFDIVLVPLDEIEPSPRNFYEPRDIEELADSIEKIGLSHNIVLAALAENGRKQIISGERRYRAFLLLRERDPDKWSKIPSLIIDDPDERLQELRLIHANSTARILNDREKVMQAARLTELLGDLKAEGEPIKGRVRDLVAKEMGVSAAQAGNYTYIAQNAAPVVLDALGEECVTLKEAREIAKLPKDRQAEQLKQIKKTERGKITSSDGIPKIDRSEAEQKLHALVNAIRGGTTPGPTEVLEACEAALNELRISKRGK